MLLQDPAALVERLRTGDLEARELAETEFIRLGAAAVPALDRASSDPDPEVSARARSLLMGVLAPHRQEVAREIAHLAVHARLAASGKFPVSPVALGRAMESIDASHPLAREGAWIELTERTTPAGELSAEALQRRLRFPGPARWQAARPQIQALLDRCFEHVCKTCVRRRLDTLKVGLGFENAKVEDILAQLGEVGGVTLIIDAGVSDEERDLQLDRAVTIEAKDVVLAEALKRVLRPYGMGYRVTEEGVVLIGTRWKSAE